MTDRYWKETSCEHGQVGSHPLPDDLVKFEDWGSWVKCDRSDCGLEIVRPGKVQCECDGHGTKYDSGFGPMGGERTGCPGGSRTELFPATPNYEAAIRMFDDEYGNGTAGQWMKATVDAGLVGVILLQEKT